MNLKEHFENKPSDCCSEFTAWSEQDPKNKVFTLHAKCFSCGFDYIKAQREKIISDILEALKDNIRPDGLIEGIVVKEIEDRWK